MSSRIGLGCLDQVEDLDALDRSLPSPDADQLAWMGYGTISNLWS